MPSRGKPAKTVARRNKRFSRRRRTNEHGQMVPVFNGENVMYSITRNGLVAVIVSGALAALVMQSFADDISPARRAAIMKCTQIAHAAYPNDDPTAHDGRDQVYEACMTDAGQLP
jgi:hypothetical protein